MQYSSASFQLVFLPCLIFPFRPFLLNSDRRQYNLSRSFFSCLAPFSYSPFPTSFLDDYKLASSLTPLPEGMTDSRMWKKEQTNNKTAICKQQTTGGNLREKLLMTGNTRSTRQTTPRCKRVLALVYSFVCAESSNIQLCNWELLRPFRCFSTEPNNQRSCNPRGQRTIAQKQP